MTIRIGKYKVRQDEDKLCVNYVYTLSDFIGGFGYLTGIIIGILTLYVAFRNFNITKLYHFNFWFLFLFGAFLLCYFLYVLILALYNPRSGILLIDKRKGEIIIKDFFKNQAIKISEVSSMYCNIVENRRPKQKYGIFTIGTRDGDKIECFIIRSSNPIDLGKRNERDIFDITNKLKNLIMKFIK